MILKLKINVILSDRQQERKIIKKQINRPILHEEQTNKFRQYKDE